MQRTVLRQVDSRSHGFTLLELLVVIAIIAALMGLTTYVMYNVGAQAERASTKATLRKINGLLRDRIEAFDRSYKGDIRRQYVQRTIDILRANTTVGTNLDPYYAVPDSAPSALLVTARKTAFRYYFPQRLADLLIGDTDTQLSGVPDSLYTKLLGPVARQQLVDEGTPTPTQAEVLGRVTTNWANHDPDTESSELLYYALIRSGTFGASAVAANRFTQAEVTDTDGDGLPEFVDRWGEPLRFYRWPTRLVDQDGLPGVSDEERAIAKTHLRDLPPEPFLAGERDLASTDPDDPVGLINSFLTDNPTWGLTSVINVTNYHDLDTYHAPLVVSAGVDGVMGLSEPYDTGSFGHLGFWDNTTIVKDAMFDNLTNRSSRAGGGGR